MNQATYFQRQEIKIQNLKQQKELTHQQVQRQIHIDYDNGDGDINNHFHYSQKIGKKNCLVNHLMVAVSRCINGLDSFQGIFKYKITEKQIQAAIVYNMQVDDDIDISIKKQISQQMYKMAKRYFKIIEDAINTYQLRVEISQFQQSLRKKFVENRYDLLMGNTNNINILNQQEMAL